MTAFTESDIQELKDLINGQSNRINQRFDEIDRKFDEIREDIHGLDKRLTVIETRLEEWKPAIDKIPDLAKADEKLDYVKETIADLKKQSEKQDNRLWLLISGLFLTLLGAIAKILFFPNP